MAYTITDQKHIAYEDGTSKQIVEIRCDAAADLPTPGANWELGSIAWVVGTGDFYGLNSTGTWDLQEK